MADKINVPSSMLKKFLASKDCRVKPEAVKAFEKKFREWADGIATSASQKATDAKRKTIQPEDLD